MKGDEKPKSEDKDSKSSKPAEKKLSANDQRIKDGEDALVKRLPYTPKDPIRTAAEKEEMEKIHLPKATE